MQSDTYLRPNLTYASPARSSVATSQKSIQKCIESARFAIRKFTYIQSISDFIFSPTSQASKIYLLIELLSCPQHLIQAETDSTLSSEQSQSTRTRAKTSWSKFLKHHSQSPVSTQGKTRRTFRQ